MAAVVVLGLGFGCSQDAAETRPSREPTSPSASLEPAHPAEPVSYDRDIRPILSDRCFRCHGADPSTREAQLRLDTAEEATADRGGKPAIVPGHPEASELWRKVSAADPAEAMPPAAANKPRLSKDELALVARWIREGARYEPHWSFVPPTRPEVPLPPAGSTARNEIDLFVDAELARRGLAPNPEADRETLFRRVTLELTGLPPTPEEVDAFLADARPDAYERWVDKLLGEEPYRSRYAERMTAPWLDAARYADTCGIHTDAGRSIWPWRDWVLAAFRDGKPFDAFLTEQIAGDLLPEATRAQKVASGFNRNHVTTDEGGAIDAEYLVEYAVDRTATMGSVFLGLTLGCARCHDHKFDPVTQTDFYRLYAYFNSIEEPGLYSQLPDPNRAHEPFLEVPSPEQEREAAELDLALAKARAERDAPTPGDDRAREEFLAEIQRESGVAWSQAKIEVAASQEGATLALQPDGSVLASGKNPETDVHVLTLRVAGNGQRLLALEALPDPSLAGDRVGRAPNGNAVLTGFEVEAFASGDAEARRPVAFGYGYASHEQPNGDFTLSNVLGGADSGEGWAVEGHVVPGGRVALFLADRPFAPAGEETLLRVKLSYRSRYAQHTLGRVRLWTGTINDAGVARLPVAQGSWYRVGPFPAEDPKAGYEKAFGPDEAAALDFKRNFGAGNQVWRYAGSLVDGRTHELPGGSNATFVARNLYAPSARTLELGLGSDDGVRVSVAGRSVFERRTDRSVAVDQEKVPVELRAGRNLLALRIVNTGGQGGFAYRQRPTEAVLAGELAFALFPPVARAQHLETRFRTAWRIAHAPAYRALTERIAALEARQAALAAKIPKTMVMKERPEPRETWVLTRGQYDQPDKTRPVVRGVPELLGALPDGAPADRRGLAAWLTSPSNPLVARVAVNRLWELFFGTGIVRTTEDFGLQGEWPSHPELLDWLAVTFREGGWNTKDLVRRIVTSATFRRSARFAPEARAKDPDNRLLSAYPRRRLTAETLRDQALFVSGLLVERLGGPSVKPYQPPGLWEEVAMPASNTKAFKRDDGEALWRRSLYTYWKRASPPANLMTLDAPTREFCTIRRLATTTPLQALVLWNDEQFVEAARVLAERTLATRDDDAARIEEIFRRATSRRPSPDEAAAIRNALEGFRVRYARDEEAAVKLASIGVAPRRATLDAKEVAAWTLVANAVLNLDAAICRN